jgi:PAS domain-containing protein
VGIGKRAPTAAILKPAVATAPNISVAPSPAINMAMKPAGATTSIPTPIDSSSSSSSRAVPSVFPPRDSLPKVVNSNDNKDKGGGVTTSNVTSIIGNYNDNSSDETSVPQIQAHYHVNEDDMMLTDNVLMCPFIFRTQDAVLCGALAECVMPGMLRAQFSDRNKIDSLEMVYDAMGFMQQLERSSGNEDDAHIVPNSLEMALQPSIEARAITTAKPPFRIVSVNEAWTQATKYSQMDVEGKELSLLDGKRTDPEFTKRSGKPAYIMTEIAKGRPACVTNVYHDKRGNDFIAFVSSFPLTNHEDEINHILHTFKKLPEPTTIEFTDTT